MIAIAPKDVTTQPVLYGPESSPPMSQQPQNSWLTESQTMGFGGFGFGKMTVSRTENKAFQSAKFQFELDGAHYELETDPVIGYKTAAAAFRLRQIQADGSRSDPIGNYYIDDQGALKAGILKPYPILTSWHYRRGFSLRAT